ncbi:unnamed protein product [Enterobius vermicularis]|uniref:beta-N-acetylhexosaminidase n=1 Tax=Enterobius vermicularis TaxID=51028 RepID=A0A0N4V6F8_ENTVE|nr:unnamed protein product [Enterobius vermicularis]
MLCSRSLRRTLRCAGNRRMCIDLFFLVLFILACSIVVSHLHASPPLRAAPQSAQIDIFDNPPARRVVDDKPLNEERTKVGVGKEVFQIKRGQYKFGKEDMELKKTSQKYINGISYPLLNSIGNFIPIRRIVHLDLKGGAYKPYFFDQIFQLLKDLRATGILIEWEDMFPYRGRLSTAINGNAYTVEDVNNILTSAKLHGLEVIPLVQTFGHLEWILKLENFAHLREAAAYPQVICFALEESWDLIKEMIDEVLTMHSKFGINFFHMGADEVYQVGYCNSTLKVMDREGSRERAVLWHIARVAEYIHGKKDVSVLAWHDMLVQATEDDFLYYKVNDLVEPVLWSYAEQLDQYLYPSTWSTLKPFKKVWSASVFKGADGPMQYRSNPIHYIRNNEAWTEQMTNNYQEFEYIQGIIISGWSRYDHMAVLCELLPVAVPSLAMTLETLIEGRKLDGEYSLTVKLFKCSPPTRPGFVYGCQFPGRKVYELINEFYNQHDQLQHYLMTDFEFNGWLSKVAVKYRHSSPMYLEKILHFLEFHLVPLEKLEADLRDELSKIYFNETVDEFMLTYVEDSLSMLKERYKAGLELSKQHYFPKRPFIKSLFSSTTKL